MKIKIILGLIAFVSLFVWQMAFIKALPGGQYFYVPLVVLVFILVSFNLENAVLWFLLYGFLLDLFSFRFFGFYTLLMMVILLIAYFLLSNVFTNRSLYVYCLLVAVSVLLYDFGNYLMFGWSWSGLLNLELKRLLANFLLTTVMFYAFGLLSHRLRPVFLIRNKN